MQGSDNFKKVIQENILDRAKHDPRFKARVELKSKNIDDCIIYVLNTVKDSGKNGFEDGEVFAIAYDYYEKANVKKGKAPQGRIVTNRKEKDTPKAKEKKTTSQKLYEKAKAEPKAKAKPEPKVVNMPPPKVDKTGQASLF